MSKSYGIPTVEIVEQTHSKPIRFRYRCEGRSVGSIMGVNSTDKNKTYPAIRVLNYDGRVAAVVSCVTVDERPKPHPNCLIGKGCDKGVRSVEFNTFAAKPEVISFKNLGIECSTAKLVSDSLTQRRDVTKIDPFKTGFEHMYTPKMINLHQVRLCFQVFIQKDPSTKPRIPLPPVLSHIISNKNHTNMKLVIHNVSDQSSPPCGGKKIMIFCDKVDKNDIAIQFYEEDEQRSVVWKELVQLMPSNIHRQVGIAFKTPAYKIKDISGPVKVFFRLQTLSTKSFSDPIAFQYVPDPSCIGRAINNKKRKMDESRSLCDYMQTSFQPPHPPQTYNIDPSHNQHQPITQSQHQMDPSHGIYSMHYDGHGEAAAAQPVQALQMYNIEPVHNQNQPITQSQHQMNPSHGIYSMPYDVHGGAVVGTAAAQPLHAMQMYNIEPPHNQYQPMTQSRHQMDPSHGIYSMPYDVHGGAISSITAASVLRANKNVDCCRGDFVWGKGEQDF